MICNKKMIPMILGAFVLVSGMTGCSNKTNGTGELNTATVASAEIKSDSASIGDAVKTEDELDEKYTEFFDEMKKGIPVGQEDRLKIFEKNLPIMKALNRKSMEFCGSGFYLESTITSTGSRERKIIVKEYWQEGNYRSEQYGTTGKLEYLEVYNKYEDITYNYETEKDLLKKITKSASKGLAPDRYKFGYFTLTNNALSGNFETIDYNGKKAVLSESSVDEKDKNGKNYKIVWHYWYDDETGILLKEEQKDFSEGKVQTDSVDSVLKPNQKFDEAVFKYDPNNKAVGDLKK
jgi:hypothetical protein